APAAGQRRAGNRLIGVIDQIHGRPGLTWLPARPPLPPPAQRPVPALLLLLLLVRAIRRRRPGRRGGILTGLTFQLLHPGSQPLILRRQLLVPPGELADQPVCLSQPRRKLRYRKSRQLLRTGHTRRIGHTTQ